MKRTLKVVTVLMALSLFTLHGQRGSGPADVRASEPETTDAATDAYFGARFKEGKGVELAEEMRNALKLETVEVAEELLSSEVAVAMQVYATTPTVQATGLIREQQATLKVGSSVALASERGTATLTRLAPTPQAGEYEGTFEITPSGDVPAVGDSVVGVIPQPNGEPVAVIPASALLETVSGHFVYVANGKHYLRTPVTIGRSGGDRIEVADGLYPGDVVVKHPVRPLWYAELQALRGGKACADGH